MSEIKQEKEIKTTVVSYEEFTDIDFSFPANFYILTAMGDYLFLHTSDRKKAQDYVDEHYSKLYKVKSSKLEKGSGNYTVRGTQSR